MLTLICRWMWAQVNALRYDLDDRRWAGRLYAVPGDRRKWANVDLENEEGCGICAVEYKDKNHVHSTQWAIGLECSS